MTQVLVEDFSDALALLVTGLYEVRPGVAPVVLETGGVRPGVPVAPVLGVPCSVQPVQGDDVQRLPEGQRLDAWRTVFTRYPLQGADENTGRTGDVLVDGGELYEVQKSFPWQGATGVTHAVVRKLGR